MKNKYKFTADTFNRNDCNHFLEMVGELAKIDPITPWDEFEVGDILHLPNTLAYKRADFIIYEINHNFMTGLIKEENDEWKNYSIFKSETRAKFMVKRINLNKN